MDLVASTEPFVVDGEEQLVEVFERYPRQHVRRYYLASQALIDQLELPSVSCCCIEHIVASPSGRWLVTQRNSGNGDWGYDIFSTKPLARVAGVVEEPGYMLEYPLFAPDESYLVGGAGEGFLGRWWVHPGDEDEDPARGGIVQMGFLFVHRLPSHEVSRHKLLVDLPAGWKPDDLDDEWYGPDVEPIDGGVSLMPSWGVPMVVPWPLPPVILLPVPHPLGEGLL